ncbi:MAG TPA: NAD(P)-dependent oxidoreductase [Candidatus Gastranaerophilales bacterium]|nr:NAD(P)-dependent oxidoreductase [Candidatus Gastranaerophilales bacterium]
MKILVTGSAGFIGKHLVFELEKQGHEIFAFSQSLGDDICDKNAFNKFHSQGIDAVFHLAGKTFVPQSWENPRDFYEVNILGTQNVLDFCRKTQAKMIYISAYVYGIPQYLPIDEKHPVNPNNPYAHSKYLAEELCRFYSENFGVKTVILRPFNLYGDGQKENFLIPSLIRQLKENNEIIVKDATPRRDYLHISDFINACVLSLNCQNAFNLFNVGSGKSFSIKEIIEIITTYSDKELKWESLGEKRQGEIPDTQADCALLINELDWKPQKDFKNSIINLKETFL